MDRLRTIDQTISELKKADPGCQLTKWGLRGLVKDGVIPTLRFGNRVLLSVESVERYVSAQLRDKELN